MKIFICYARVDKPFCKEFVKVIDNHDVFLDDRMYAGDDWWSIILQRIAWCEVFVFLISMNGLRSHYCNRELQVALKLGKAILPVLVDAEAEKHIPASLSKIQWADMTGTVTDDVKNYVTRSLYEIEQRITSRKASPAPAQVGIGHEPPPYPTNDDPVTHIGMASKAMEKGDFERARDILMRLNRQNTIQGMQRQIVEDMIQHNDALLAEQMTERQRDMDYRILYELAQYPINRASAVKYFRDFQRRFPDYDPRGVTKLLFGDRPNFPAAPQAASAAPMPTPRPQTGKLATAGIQGFRMDMLEFLPVHTVSRMRPFEMARYPIVNAQFNMFLRDPNGAARTRWWSYSSYAQNYHQKNNQIRPSSNTGDTHPRDSISWYDAVAFCYWLSEKLGKKVFLPTRAQRMRAAQGSDGRIFPWGSIFNKELCNSRESGRASTTPVTMFPGGASPYGIMDMSGNCWEWCVDAPSHNRPFDLKTNAKRAVMGGGFRSNQAQLVNDYTLEQAPDTQWPMIGFRVIVML
jgi:formylglycine-generating enzyme required for sulfatase activity